MSAGIKLKQQELFQLSYVPNLLHHSEHRDKPGHLECYDKRFMVGERGSVASLGDQLIWHLQGFHVHEFVSAVGFLFPWHRTVPVMSSHIKHSINFYYDWTVLWLEQHCSAWRFSDIL